LLVARATILRLVKWAAGNSVGHHISTYLGVITTVAAMVALVVRPLVAAWRQPQQIKMSCSMWSNNVQWAVEVLIRRVNFSYAEVHVLLLMLVLCVLLPLFFAILFWIYSKPGCPVHEVFWVGIGFKLTQASSPRPLRVDVGDALCLCNFFNISDNGAAIWKDCDTWLFGNCKY
jgi:hypothetical protein